MAWAGLSKSGSPMVSAITCLPSARMARARIVMATVAAGARPSRRWARVGVIALTSMVLLQALAEMLDPRAGVLQAFGVGGVADAEMAGIHEGGAMDGGDAFFL